MRDFTVRPDDTLLLLIDLQERMLPSMANSNVVCKNSKVLLEAAKAFEMPVLYTEQYPKGLGATVSELKETLDAVHAVCSDKTAFNAITPSIEAALSDAPLSARKKVIVTGIEAHICVFQTVRTLLERGYEVFIPVDAISSRDEKNKETARRLFIEMGAVVTCTESLLFDLLRDSKNPHFKALQALIK